MGGIGTNGSPGSGRPRLRKERLCSSTVSVLPSTRKTVDMLAELTGKSMSRTRGEFIDRHIGLLEDEVILEAK